MSSSRYEEYWLGSNPSPLTDPLTERRRQFLWRRVGQLDSPGARLLDCGAGDGSLVAEAELRGLVSAGLEVSSAGVARALASHPAIDVRLHSVEVLPWPVDPESWDVVTAFEVIEHLLEPRALLEGARSALVPGGALALSTPYHGLVKNLVIAALGFDRHFAVDGDHVRFFTDRALRRLLGEHGFRIVETAHFGRIGPLWANTTVWAVKT